MGAHSGSISTCQVFPDLALYLGCVDPQSDQVDLCRTDSASAMAFRLGASLSLRFLLEDDLACFSMGFALWDFLRELLTWG